MAVFGLPLPERMGMFVEAKDAVSLLHRPMTRKMIHPRITMKDPTAAQLLLNAQAVIPIEWQIVVALLTEGLKILGDQELHLARPIPPVPLIPPSMILWRR